MRWIWAWRDCEYRYYQLTINNNAVPTNRIKLLQTIIFVVDKIISFANNNEIF